MTDLPEELQERIDIISHKLKFMAQRPTVACITAIEPGRLATDELARQITLAGGTSLAGDADTLLQLNPEVIILKPEGYSIEQSMSAINSLFELEGFDKLTAVKTNRFYIIDGNLDFTSNADTFVNSVELLAEIIYPKQFIFGYEGDAWVKFSLS